jgi:hypothetical protein
MHKAHARRTLPDDLSALGRLQLSWERKPAHRPPLGVNIGFTLQEGFPRTSASMGDRPRKPDDIPLDAYLQDCDALAHQGLGDYSSACGSNT